MILGILFTFAVTKIVVCLKRQDIQQRVSNSMAIYMCIAAVFISINRLRYFRDETECFEADQVEFRRDVGLVEGYDG